MTARPTRQELRARARPAPPFWLSPTSYWLPERISSTSAWLTHAPFAFWLMDVLRPRSIVELGTHYGFSCFVFAEAVRRLGLDCTISALDSWEGDDQAGIYGEDVYESVAGGRGERSYPDTVRLVRGYFDDSRPLVADDSVDLLHIDGRHGYEDVLADYTAWRSTVRDGGIILFHDIAEHQRGLRRLAAVGRAPCAASVVRVRARPRPGCSRGRRGARGSRIAALVRRPTTRRRRSSAPTTSGSAPSSSARADSRPCRPSSTSIHGEPDLAAGREPLRCARVSGSSVARHRAGTVVASGGSTRGST